MFHDHINAFESVSMWQLSYKNKLVDIHIIGL